MFPVRGKVPVVSGGLKSAVWTAGDLEGWGPWPGDGYGLVPGPGWMVVDIDVAGGKVGAQSWLALIEAHGDPGETLTVQTPSGGWHLYFQLGEGASVRASVGKLGPGLDIRGNMLDGYVVGPGSAGYVLVADAPGALAPDWLVELCRSGGGSGAGAGAGEGVGLVRVRDADLRRCAGVWRKRGEQGQAMAAVALGVVAGSGYARQGSVYVCTRDFAYWLAGEFPYLDWAWFRDRYLEPCWMEIWGADYVVGRISRHWERLWRGGLERRASERAARLAGRDAARLGRVRAASGGARSELYSDAEMAGWAGDMGVDEWKRSRLIVQCERAHYVFFDGDYRGPFRDGVGAQCRDLLAAVPGVECEKFVGTSGEIALRSGTELVRDYGCTVDRVVPVLGLDRSRVSGRVFLEACARFRGDLTGTWSSEVDDWLRGLCRDGYDAVMDWIGVLGDLGRAAPAVWFLGGSGTGKSLFAAGVAGLWGGRVCDLRDALSRFNSEILRCPVVFGDEQIPRDTRGLPDIEALKALISSTAHRIERKGVDVLECQGALRVVLAANNEDMLALQKNLSVADIQALADRIICVRVPEDCGALDASVAGRWLEGDVLSNHFKWIVENRDVAGGRRFACAARGAGLEGRLLAHSPLHAAILDHVAGAVLGGGMGWNSVGVDRKGRILVSPTGLRDDAAVSGAFRGRVSGADIGVALAALSLDGWVRRRGCTRKYRSLDPDAIDAWLETSDVDSDVFWRKISERQAAAINSDGRRNPATS